jgi:hypothetical protein
MTGHVRSRRGPFTILQIPLRSSSHILAGMVRPLLRAQPSQLRPVSSDPYCSKRERPSGLGPGRFQARETQTVMPKSPPMPDDGCEPNRHRPGEYWLRNVP